MQMDRLQQPTQLWKPIGTLENLLVVHALWEYKDHVDRGRYAYDDDGKMYEYMFGNKIQCMCKYAVIKNRECYTDLNSFTDASKWKDIPEDITHIAVLKVIEPKLEEPGLFSRIMDRIYSRDLSALSSWIFN